MVTGTSLIRSLSLHTQKWMYSSSSYRSSQSW